MADPATPQVSVIIRAKDKVDVLGQAIASVRAQTLEAEVVVVDSGSTDGTRELAEALADRVVRIDPQDFTYGRALNVGAAAATAPYLVALSSHCVLRDTGWLARCVELLSVAGVGAAAGKAFSPDGRRLDDVVFQDRSALRAEPLWTMSNHASGFRAEVQQVCPFDEDVGASEDVIFAHRISDLGWRIALDPRLFVSPGHRRRAGLRGLYERKRKEVAASAGALDLPPFGLREAARWWWRDVPRQWTESRALARMNPRRLVALAGIIAGRRDAARLRRPPSGRGPVVGSLP